MTRVWRVLTGVVLALTGIASLIVIVEWCTAPTINLKGTVDYAELELPPDYFSWRAGADSVLLERESALESVFPPEDIRYFKQLVDGVLNALQDYTQYGKYSKIEGWWAIDLVNEGDRTARQVKLLVPLAGFASIRREDGKAAFHEFTTVLDLGDIQPNEGLDIIAWTNYTAPSSSWFANFELRHSEGLGDLELLGPTGTVGRFVDRHQVFLGLIVVWVVLSVALVIGGALEKKRVNTSGDTSETKTSDNGENENGQPKSSA